MMQALRLRLNTLRAQFALVIALLSFIPNVVVALTLGRVTGVLPLVTWMVLVAALSGMIGYLLSGALIRPLARLTSELRAHGDLAARVDDPGEVRALRAAFRALFSKLDEEQGRRNAFMATLVHDLKTPIIATSHLITVLRDHPLPAADQAQVYAQVLDENARLLHLVQKMADAHKFERDDVPLSLRPADLRRVAGGVLERFRGQVGGRLNLALSGEGRAEVDTPELERALSNLIENALRYASRAVRVEAGPGALRVLDDGPGLVAPLSQLAQPFNAQPVEIAGERYTAGTAGLGLYIARRVAEAHGGRLSYRRESGWSVFELDLPPAPKLTAPGLRPELA